MKNTLLFASLASLSLSLIACTTTPMFTSNISAIAAQGGGSTTVTAAVGATSVTVPFTVTKSATATSSGTYTTTCTLASGAPSGWTTSVTSQPAAPAGTATTSNGVCTVSFGGAATAGQTATVVVGARDNSSVKTNFTVNIASSIAPFRLDAGKAAGTPAADWTLDNSNTGWACFTDATLATAVTGANGTPTANNATQVTTVTGAGTGTFAPQSVYLDERYCTSGGNFSVAMRYARTAATAGLYKVRLHFAELYNGTGQNPAGGPRMIRVRVDNGTSTGTFQNVTLPVAGACTTVGVTTTCSSTPVAVDLPVTGNVAASGTINVVVAAIPNIGNTANSGDPTVAGIEFLPQ